MIRRKARPTQNQAIDLALNLRFTGTIASSFFFLLSAFTFHHHRRSAARFHCRTTFWFTGFSWPRFAHFQLNKSSDTHRIQDVQNCLRITAACRSEGSEIAANRRRESADFFGRIDEAINSSRVACPRRSSRGKSSAGTDAHVDFFCADFADHADDLAAVVPRTRIVNGTTRFPSIKPRMG